MTYKHGVYVSEQATSIVPPTRIGAAMPVVVGTAPVHLVADANWPVNTPKLFYTYPEAVAAMGYSTDWANWTICEFLRAFFGLFGVGPVVVINVFDPATHKVSVEDESKSFADGTLTLAHDGLVADPEVTDSTGATVYDLTDDYTVDRVTGVITRVATGDIGETEAVLVSYDYADPSAVTTADVIGTAGKGLQLVEEVFPRFRLVPGQIVAPGWSHKTGVAAEMMARAKSINGLFNAIAIVDVDSGTVTSYTAVPTNKETNNLTDPQCVVCWPKVSLGGVAYWMSSQLAGLLAQVDAGNDDIPFRSPSNKNFQMDSAVANGSEVWLTIEQANYLNGQGIVTALNFTGGWKCWGSRTGAYPSVTDVKDAFLPIRRMFNWIGNALVTTYWQKVDFPITRRLVETIVDGGNIWLNGLVGRQFILGGRIEFQEDENPVTDLMDGIIKLHCYVTPPSPAREIDFILEYDPEYLETLFG